MHLSIALDTRNPFGARPRRARFTSEKVTIPHALNAKRPPGETPDQIPYGYDFDIPVRYFICEQ